MVDGVMLGWWWMGWWWVGDGGWENVGVVVDGVMLGWEWWMG